MTCRSRTGAPGTRALTFAFAAVLFAVAAHAGENPDLAPATQQYDFAAGLLARNLYADADAEFSNFIRRFPDDPRAAEAVLWRAEARYQAGGFLDAARDFHAFLTRPQRRPTDNDDFARVRYGCCLCELGRHEQAAQTLEAMPNRLSLAPDLKQLAAWCLGRSRLALGQAAKAAEAFGWIQEGPLAADALFLRAEALAQAEQSGDAAALFARFAALYPDHAKTPDARLREAEALRAAGDGDAARAAFDALIRDNRSAAPGDPAAARVARAWYGLAWLRLNAGDRSGARDAVAKALPSAAPDLADGLRYLDGYLALEDGDAAAAAKRLGEITDGPFAEDAARRRVWALVLAGEYQEALAAADRFDRDFPKTKDGPLHYLRGRARAGLGDWSAAARAFAAERDSGGPAAADAAYELALALERADDNPDAAKAYADFIRRAPRHAKIPDAFAGLGRALAATGDWSNAAVAFERVLAVKPDPVRDADWRIPALAQAAAARYRLDDTAAMAKLYQRLLDEDAQRRKTAPKDADAAPHPSGAEAWYWLGWLDAKNERFAAAAEKYGRVADEYPSSPLAAPARYRRAMCLYRDGQADGAAAALLALVKENGREVDRQEMLWLARHLLDAGRSADADAVYAALLSRDPKPSEAALAHYWRGEIRRTDGQWREGLAEYDAVLALPDTALAQEAGLGRIACLRGLKRTDEARRELMALEASLPADAQIGFRWLHELAATDEADGNVAAALSGYMRVGMLSADGELAGQSLLAAGDLARRTGDATRARICYEDLAGLQPDSYGKRFPDSAYARTGRERLAQPAKDRP